MECDIGLVQGRHNFFGWLLVGKQGVDFRQMPQTHHGIAPELGVVGHQQHIPGVFNNRLGNPHFPIVKIEQGAIVIDSGNADNAVIHLELADEVDGRLADNAAVAGADHPAGDNDLKTRCCCSTAFATFRLLVMIRNP